MNVQLFELIVTRFETAPEVIIYDNGCNLQSYCLNNEPEFFKSTRFFVDEFHYKHHTNCNTCFNSLHMSSQDPTLQFSLCEQQNLKMSALTFPFARMNPTNSLTQLRHLVTRINRYEWSQIYNYNSKSNDLQKLRERLEQLVMNCTPSELDGSIELEGDLEDDDRIHELIEELEVDAIDDEDQGQKLTDHDNEEELSESELEGWRSASEGEDVQGLASECNFDKQ